MNLLELMIKVGVDDRASDRISGIANSAKSGLATVARAGATAVAALGAGTAAVGKAALDAYGDFEQLSGGAALMFGDAYDYIEKKSQEAYKNVQMSQNDYLQQVNGFAVGLRESFGGNEQAAAELADKIITAEADIVAATGNTQENVQNAFNGIMKGNYQMLDNLQIGIKPTKEGMQEVIDKVNEWNAAQGRASDYTIDSLADCEAALVDYVEMVGMSGYAQNEAASTIQGSLAMVRASWENLLTELGKDNADIGARVVELVDSATTALLGAVDENGERVSEGILGRVRTIIQNISDTLPEILPKLREGITEIVNALVPIIIQLTPILIDAALTLFMALLEGLVQASPQIVEGLIQLVFKLCELLVKYTPQLAQATWSLMLGILQGIINAITPAMQAMNELGQGILDAIGGFFGALWNAGVELVNSIINGAAQTGNDMARFFGDWINAAYQSVVNFGSWFYNAGVEIINGLINGIANNIGAVVDTITGGVMNAVNSVRAALGIASPSKLFAGIGEFTMEGLAKGIEDAAGKAEKAMRGAAAGVYDAAEGDIAFGMTATADSSLGGSISALRDELRNMQLALYIDGREFARATVGSMEEALNDRIGRSGRVYA